MSYWWIARSGAQGPHVCGCRRVARYRALAVEYVGRLSRAPAQIGVGEIHGEGDRDGGRREATLRSTIECVPEIVAAVGKRIPVFIDGGIRRGTDIFKALALGATAVGVGRPQVWGVAAFGQPGVEAISDILNRELRTIMRQAGTPDLAAINRDHLAWPKFPADDQHRS